MNTPSLAATRLCGGIALAVCAFGTAQSAPLQVFEVNANTAAGIQQTVDDFRAALGPFNAPAPVNGDPNGRRQINWDAAPDAISDPNVFPGAFFNANIAPRARGIEFQAAGATAAFQLSSTLASGQPIEFGTPDQLTFFSAERLFTPRGDTLFDVKFFDPADQAAPALTRGLGVVFTNVSAAGAASMSFYDAYDALIYEKDVAWGERGSLSFLGATFSEAEVARVRINAGIDGAYRVAMDDFIFGEPVAAAPVPLPAPAALLMAGLLGLGVASRRRA